MEEHIYVSVKIKTDKIVNNLKNMLCILQVMVLVRHFFKVNIAILNKCNKIHLTGYDKNDEKRYA